MSYIVPSVLVYQQLENAGGVLNATPDLDTCIVGPAYNILKYVSGSAASQVKTAALSTVTTTGDMDGSTAILTNVANPGAFSVGDKILVIGAGVSGANLQALVLTIVGNIITLDTVSGKAVVGAVVTKSGSISDPTITNTFSLPGQLPGQTVAPSTIVPWLNAVKAETVLNGLYGYGGSSLGTINIPTGVTGSISASSTTLTITTAAMATQWAKGDVVSIANAGAGGNTPHIATITNISGTTFTVTPQAVTLATTQAVSKILVANLNSTTNTLRVEAGDVAHISYTSLTGIASTFDTKVNSVVTGTNQTGTLVTIGFTDTMPFEMSVPITSGTVGAASTAMVVASGTGFSTGDTVLVYGAGVAGANLETTITVSGTSFTLGVATTIAVTNAKVRKVLRTTAALGAGATTLTLVSGGGAHFAIGDRVIIDGVGANGSDMVALLSNVSSNTLTFATTPTVTAPGVVSYVKKINNYQLSIRKTYNNQQLAATKPISGGANFDTSTAATNGQVVISANPELVYGKIISADVYFAYNALRTDLSGTIGEVSSIDDVIGDLGDITDANPLGLALELALANTIGRVWYVGVPTNDLAGHEVALQLLENHRMYCLVPLTQDTAIIEAYQVHVDQMSTPINASWRVVLANTAIPTTQSIGQYSSGLVNSNAGNNAVAINTGNYVLTSSNSTFISDGVVAGDIVTITASSPSTIVGTHKVLSVVSNQQLIIEAAAVGSSVSFYVSRSLTKSQQATAVALASTTFGDKRVYHVQPDLVGVTVDGVVKYLPGYYLCAAIGGAVSGFPVQQGFTNIGIAGISDLKHSNFYFGRADLNTMAAAGTFLLVQATQSGIPYVRHELSTDVSVLEYRELLLVKNWDFLSYYFYDKLSPFIGKWNITTETINSIRQTIVASAELLKGQKLPKIGAPLIAYSIRKLAQNAVNKDQLDVEVPVTLVYPNNNTNLYLII